MKTHKKFISALCAVAMLISTLPTASATETEPLSEWAGKTLPVQVVEETEDGMTSRVIEVAIPEGATEAEKDALIYSVITGRGAAFTYREAVDSIYMSYDQIAINYIPAEIAHGTTTMDLDSLYVHMTFIGTIPSGMMFQVRNGDNDTSNWNGNIQYVNTPDAYYEVVFLKSDFAIRAQTSISVWAKASHGGIANLNYCYVAGYKR